MGGTPRSWVFMPRRRQPAYVMEGCGMEVDCGGTQASVVVLQTFWSTRKTPVQSASVSDDHTVSPKASPVCACRDKVFNVVLKVRPVQCLNKLDLVCVCVCAGVQP